MPIPPVDLGTTSADAAAARRARRGTLLTLGALVGLIVLIVLLTPVRDSDSDSRLTTTRYGAGNARLAYDLAGRLGWPVRRSARPLRGSLDTAAIYAVFDGPTTMPTQDRVAILDAVRRGAGLLVAPQAGAPYALLDSLGLSPGKIGLVTRTPLGSCPTGSTDPLDALQVRTRMVTFKTPQTREKSDRPKVPWPADAHTLLASDVQAVPGGTRDDDDDDADTDAAGDSATAVPGAESLTVTPIAGAATTDLRPTMVAFTLGKGRVVALADPDVLRTDQLRSCAGGGALSLVRGLEFLSNGGRRPVVFAEFYQRESADGPVVVVREWLVESALGRTVLTLMLASLLLIAARGRRTLAPVYREREERRSPLEHVDALATAWQSVRGTRTVARMLARGIRRRHAAGRWRSLDDTEFLTALAARHPAIADDAARLSRAIETAAPPSELPALRQAAAHIDAECLTP
jgi:hypothetical protein